MTIQQTPGAPQDTTSVPGTGTPQAPAAPSTTPAADSTPTGTSTTTPPADEAQDVSSLPTWAQKLIKSTNAEAAKHRTEKQAANQQRDAMLKVLGYTPNGTTAPPTPEELTEKLGQQQAQTWELGAQLAVVRTATAAGADADALLDSNTFLDSLAEFVDDDPNTAEFRTKMAAHIAKFVTEHPKFKTAPAGPARSGGDHPGGGSTPTTRPKSLHAAVSQVLGGS